MEYLTMRDHWRNNLPPTLPRPSSRKSRRSSAQNFAQNSHNTAQNSALPSIAPLHGQRPLPSFNDRHSPVDDNMTLPPISDLLQYVPKEKTPPQSPRQGPAFMDPFKRVPAEQLPPFSRPYTPGDSPRTLSTSSSVDTAREMVRPVLPSLNSSAVFSGHQVRPTSSGQSSPLRMTTTGYPHSSPAPALPAINQPYHVGGPVQAPTSAYVAHRPYGYDPAYDHAYRRDTHMAGTMDGHYASCPPGYPSYHQYSFPEPPYQRKRRGNLPKEATNRLKQWYNDHRESPYPTEEEKIILCHETGLSINQVSNWFINARRRNPGRQAGEAGSERRHS